MAHVDTTEQYLSDEILRLLRANRQIRLNGSTLWIGDVCITVKKGSALLARLHDLANAVRLDDELD